MLNRYMTVFFLTLTLSACGVFKSDSNDSDKKNKSEDGKPGDKNSPPADSADPGFNIIDIQFDGLKADVDKEEECTKKVAGHVFIHEDYAELVVCLGKFSKADENHFDFYLDDDAFEKKEIENIYLVIFSDKVNEVSDISAIALEEGADYIKPNSDYTSFSGDTLIAGADYSTVRKSSLDQVKSLEKGQGVTTRSTLVDYRDLTKLRITRGYYAKTKNDTKILTLKNIFSQK